jgi:hypothetical protein
MVVGVCSIGALWSSSSLEARFQVALLYTLRRPMYHKTGKQNIWHANERMLGAGKGRNYYVQLYNVSGHRTLWGRGLSPRSPHPKRQSRSLPV